MAGLDALIGSTVLDVQSCQWEDGPGWLDVR